MIIWNFIVITWQRFHDDNHAVITWYSYHDTITMLAWLNDNLIMLRFIVNVLVGYLGNGIKLSWYFHCVHMIRLSCYHVIKSSIKWYHDIIAGSCCHDNAIMLSLQRYHFIILSYYHFSRLHTQVLVNPLYKLSKKRRRKKLGPHIIDSTVYCLKNRVM
jgi:hypothetical protein